MTTAIPVEALPLPDAPLGLHDPSGFRLVGGAQAGVALIPAARHLFGAETVAVPVAPPFATFAPAADPFEDIRAWAATPGPLTKPPLVWIAAGERRTGIRISALGERFEADGVSAPFRVVPRIALNRSYADASTWSWLAQRTVTMRGEPAPDGGFVARTLWPEDWRIDDAAPVVSVAATAAPELAIRGLMRGAPRGGADSPFATQVIWERDGSRREWAGRAILGLVVNGSQGDDDEAWGGHFALMTGRLPADGRISDLLVANFYSLDVHSEKGILAAPVPLDNYLGDLNSGQAWYRPSFVMLAILRDERAPALVQGALNRLYLQFWRRQLPYRHATMNCASISIDTLRALGWPIRARGPSDRALAWLSVPAKIFREGSVASARTAYEYLTEDRTRLMPCAAFEEVAADLLRLARPGAGAGDGPLARWVAEDLVAVVGARVPQLPSSRRLGSWPVANPREYLDAIPGDPADVQIVPVPPRHFPDSLRDPDLLSPAARRSTLPLVAWTVTGILPLAWLAGWLWRKLRAR